MKSTGEVMGLAPDFASAFAKSQLAAGVRWAGLLRRTLALDVFACVRCGGRRRVQA